MLPHKWLIVGLSSCLLCGSFSHVDARVLKFQRVEESKGTSKEEWGNIFDRKQGRKSPKSSGGHRRSHKIKEKSPVKKRPSQAPSITPTGSPPPVAPTGSPVVSEEKDNDETTELDLDKTTPSDFPTLSPTIQPDLSPSSPPTTPNLNVQSVPLLDFQISLSHSSPSFDVSQLEKGIETALRLGMVLLDAEDIQFLTTPAQVDSSTYSFSEGYAILNDDKSLDLVQAQQIELLSDVSFVETALQQEMEDFTIRVDGIEIMLQSDLLPSAGMISDENHDINGMLMLASVVVCLLTFFMAAAVCYRRYKTVKK